MHSISLPQVIKNASGFRPASCSVGTGVLSSGVAQRPEVDHSPSTAEIKNEWSSTSTLAYAFMLCTEMALTFT